MNDPIYSELRSNVKFPDIEVSTTFVSECDASILRHRGTKQVIHLTSSEIKDILNEQEINLPWFLLKFTNELDEIKTELYNDITDGYQISEYFGNSNVYIPIFDYFRAAKFGNIDFVMNLYNGKNANISFRQIIDKIKIESDDEVASYQDLLPFPNITDTISYARFTDVLYNDKTRIGRYMYRFPSLCVNLPYEYYCTQNVPENIFTWDIDNKTLQFTNKSLTEVFEIFDSICKEGLTTPLYFQISQGSIVSASDDDYIKLIIAQYLKLPTIPAVIYVLNSTKDSDILTSMRPCDIINSYNNITAAKEVYELINDVCSPYIFFYNREYGIIKSPKAVPPNSLYRSIHLNFDINEYYLVSNFTNTTTDIEI